MYENATRCTRTLQDVQKRFYFAMYEMYEMYKVYEIYKNAYTRTLLFT